MIERFRHTLMHSCGVARGDRILVCCSGGVDSMVLLRLMLAVRDELDLKLHVVTVDHGLRCEAPGDAAFVLDTCRGLGVQASLYELGMDPRTPNLEEAARIKRYEAIQDCRVRLGMRSMATGHTLDDQAETVLYRLARGTGLKGMQGMAYARPDGLIRPMLDLTRREVEEYARAHTIGFVTDQTNDDLTLTRNLIRKRIMPLMRLINPAAQQALGRFARIAREEHGFVEDEARRLMDQAMIADWRICRVLDAARLKAAPEPVVQCLGMTLAAEMLGEPRGIEAPAAASVLEVMRGRARAHTVKRRLRVEHGAGSVAFSMVGRGPVYELGGCGQGDYLIPQIGQRVRIECKAASAPVQGQGRGEHTDCRIRSWMPGDRVADRRVVKLLADKRVIVPLRRFWPVLACGDALVAVAGIDLPGASVRATFPP